MAKNIIKNTLPIENTENIQSTSEAVESTIESEKKSSFTPIQTSGTIKTFLPYTYRLNKVKGEPIVTMTIQGRSLLGSYYSTKNSSIYFTKNDGIKIPNLINFTVKSQEEVQKWIKYFDETFGPYKFIKFRSNVQKSLLAFEETASEIEELLNKVKKYNITKEHLAELLHTDNQEVPNYFINNKLDVQGIEQVKSVVEEVTTLDKYNSAFEALNKSYDEFPPYTHQAIYENFKKELVFDVYGDGEFKNSESKFSSIFTEVNVINQSTIKGIIDGLKSLSNFPFIAQFSQAILKKEELKINPLLELNYCWTIRPNTNFVNEGDLVTYGEIRSYPIVESFSPAFQNSDIDALKSLSLIRNILLVLYLKGKPIKFEKYKTQLQNLFKGETGISELIKPVKKPDGSPVEYISPLNLVGLQALSLISGKKVDSNLSIFDNLKNLNSYIPTLYKEIFSSFNFSQKMYVRLRSFAHIFTKQRNRHNVGMLEEVVVQNEKNKNHFSHLLRRVPTNFFPKLIPDLNLKKDAKDILSSKGFLPKYSNDSTNVLKYNRPRYQDEVNKYFLFDGSTYVQVFDMMTKEDYEKSNEILNDSPIRLFRTYQFNKYQIKSFDPFQVESQSDENIEAILAQYLSGTNKLLKDENVPVTVWFELFIDPRFKGTSYLMNFRFSSYSPTVSNDEVGYSFEDTEEIEDENVLAEFREQGAQQSDVEDLPDSQTKININI